MQSPLNLAGRRDPTDPAPRSGSLSWDDYFMALAFLSAERSKDPNKQVGAVIVNANNVILGIGYNGFPRGCCDSDLPWSKVAHLPDGSPDPLSTKYPYVVHAEANALLNKNAASVDGARVYVTMFPCNECAKLLIQAGIREVVYHEAKVQHDHPPAAPPFPHGAAQQPHRTPGLRALPPAPAPTPVVAPNGCAPSTMPLQRSHAAHQDGQSAPLLSAASTSSSQRLQARELWLLQQEVDQEEARQGREVRDCRAGAAACTTAAARAGSRSADASAAVKRHARRDSNSSSVGGSSKGACASPACSPYAPSTTSVAAVAGSWANTPLTHGSSTPGSAGRGSPASPPAGLHYLPYPHVSSTRATGGTSMDITTSISAAAAAAAADGSSVERGEQGDAAWSGFWSSSRCPQQQHSGCGQDGRAGLADSAAAGGAGAGAGQQGAQQVPSSGQILSAWARSPEPEGCSAPPAPLPLMAVPAQAPCQAAAEGQPQDAAEGVVVSLGGAVPDTGCLGAACAAHACSGASGSGAPAAAGAAPVAAPAGAVGAAAAGGAAPAAAASAAAALAGDTAYLASLRMLRLAGVTLRQHRLTRSITVPGPAALCA